MPERAEGARSPPLRARMGELSPSSSARRRHRYSVPRSVVFRAGTVTLAGMASVEMGASNDDRDRRRDGLIPGQAPFLKVFRFEFEFALCVPCVRAVEHVQTRHGARWNVLCAAGDSAGSVLHGCEGWRAAETCGSTRRSDEDRASM